MPMIRGQRVRDCIYSNEAITALAQLGNRNPAISEIIVYLGQRILDLPGVCLRVDGHGTYDVAFIRPRSPRPTGSRSKAFVSFNSPTFTGRWTPAQPNTLRVGVMVNRSACFQDPLLQQRGPGQEQATGVWHDVRIGHTVGIRAGTNLHQLSDVFDVIERAYSSFD